MKKIIILIVVISIVFSACSSSKKEKNKIEKEKAQKVLRKITDSNEIKDYFEVIIDIEIQQNDDFQLFYTEDYLLVYTEKHSILKQIIGFEGNQKIIFNLPKNVFPDRIRLDVGSTITQKYIIINSLIIRFKNNEINIPEEYISEYLISNENIKFNPNDNKFYLNPVEKDGNLKYDPFFTCSPELIRLILEL